MSRQLAIVITYYIYITQHTSTNLTVPHFFNSHFIHYQTIPTLRRVANGMQKNPFVITLSIKNCIVNEITKPPNAIFLYISYCYSTLLFFAVYVIYKKKYSFSRVVFLFFQCKTANSFYSKINDSSRVRTTAFSSSRFGVQVTGQKFLRFIPNIFRNPKLVKH